ncbi:MAG: hypothetical protein ACTS4W_01765 [Candidatus Hodgkinia cicadicola]
MYFRMLARESVHRRVLAPLERRLKWSGGSFEWPMDAESRAEREPWD